MHPQLTYIIDQQRAAEIRAVAERSRGPDTTPLVLTDGRRLRIRPIERQDRDRVRRLFMRLSPESRYRRYLTPKLSLSERELDYLLDVDRGRPAALAAIDEADGAFVGAARYVQLPGRPDVADIAIEVADDLHRHGIGTALAIRTLDLARTNGIKRLTAMTSSDNAAARGLLRRLQFRPTSRRALEVEFELDLTPDHANPGAAAAAGCSRPRARA
jgi:RimJ/RimL family protein N-acetyltransferase